MGFVGVADATTCNGEVLLIPSVGLVIMSGKSFDPPGGGTCAGGAGSGLVCGDHVIGTGGVEGLLGGEGGGVVPLFMLPLPLPQLVGNASSPTKINVPKTERNGARLQLEVNKTIPSDPQKFAEKQPAAMSGTTDWMTAGGVTVKT